MDKTLLEKSKSLVELRQAIEVKEKEVEELLKPLKDERDILQAAILQELKDTEQFSARFDFATITRAVRKTNRVVDEGKVFSWLDEQGLLKEYTEIRTILTPQFDTLAKEAVKNGKIIDGMETKETEYISILKPSSKEDKRKIVTD